VETAPKVLIWDVETIGVNALRSDLGSLAVFGWKWLGEKKAHSMTLEDFGGLPGQRRKYVVDDKQLLKAASKLLNEADITVAHYGSVFDRRFFQGRLLINNLPPIPMTKMRDTKFIASSVANFTSNRLQNLALTLGLTEQKHMKTRDEWPGWWMRVLAGDVASLRAMAKYCEQDVQTLEQLYLRLRPFDNAHPRAYDKATCRVCGGHIQYRGTSIVGELKYRRIFCTSCGKWDRERKAFKG
jgi:hypothetical protein